MKNGPIALAASAFILLFPATQCLAAADGCPDDQSYQESRPDFVANYCANALGGNCKPADGLTLQCDAAPGFQPYGSDCTPASCTGCSCANDATNTNTNNNSSGSPTLPTLPPTTGQTAGAVIPPVKTTTPAATTPSSTTSGGANTGPGPACGTSCEAQWTPACGDNPGLALGACANFANGFMFVGWSPQDHANGGAGDPKYDLYNYLVSRNVDPNDQSWDAGAAATLNLTYPGVFSVGKDGQHLEFQNAVVHSAPNGLGATGGTIPGTKGEFLWRTDD